MQTETKSLEQILYGDGLLTEDQLGAIKIESANTGKSVESILESRNLVDPTALASAKAKSLGIDFIDPSNLEIPQDVIDLISEELASKNVVIPFEKSGNILKVAMADPLDIPFIESLERKTKLSVKSFLATPDKIRLAIAGHFGKSIGRDITEALSSEDDTGNATKIEENLKDVQQVDQIAQDSSVARVVNIILEYAAKSGASDIHIEPDESKSRVRYRIDGVLQEKISKIPKDSHSSIVARLKILADLKIDERRKPQDGSFKSSP